MPHWLGEEHLFFLECEDGEKKRLLLVRDGKAHMAPDVRGFYVDAYVNCMIRIRSIAGHPQRFKVMGCLNAGDTWTATLYCGEQNDERQKVTLEYDATNEKSREKQLKGHWQKPQDMICFENGKRWKRLMCHPRQMH